jgi:alkyl hydroperoxide reductase subunit F
MLSKEILQALSGYAGKMDKRVTFVLQKGEHAKRDELVDLLTGIAATGEKIDFVERDTGDTLRSPLSFLLEADGVDTGIRFSGIPGGHEFNSLILAMLQASGTKLRLDEGLQRLVTNIDEPLHFEVVVSLSCHNCPDVVQALNQFALLNPHISAEMIDGGLFPQLIGERDIQGVPSVFLNGTLFGSGKVEAAGLIDKLIERNPAIVRPEPGASLPQQDVTIIGGGPAGVSAAIYSARKGLSVTIVADRLGGQVKDTMGIENLISVPSTTGPDLTAALTAHLGEYAITIREHVRVNEIEDGDLKILTLSTGERIRTRALIIATGARWRELGVPGEKENIGNGVAYCPHCDGPFYKGKDVAVIGGGNSGLEAALDLAGIVKSVTVFEFMPELKADRVLVDRAEAKDNIKILKNVATRSITATGGKVDGIAYTERETGQEHRQELAGVFVQIGLVPNSQFVSNLVATNSAGEITVDDKCRTSVPGIFACGDVTNVPYKQIVVAIGQGATAALTAFEHLLTHEATGGIDKAAA